MEVTASDLMDSFVVLVSSDSSGPPSPECDTPSSTKTEFGDALTSASDGASSRVSLKNINSSRNTQQINDQSTSNSTRTVNKVHELSDSEDSDTQTQPSIVCQENRIQDDNFSSSGTSGKTDSISLPAVKRKPKMKTAAMDEEKERKRLEKLQKREKKQAEDAQNKALKLAVTNAYRSKKPGECLKYMTVHLDQQLLTAKYGGELLIALQSAEIQYRIQSNCVPLSVLWSRNIPGHFVGDDMKVQVRNQEKEEEEMIFVWPWNEVVRLIHTSELLNRVQTLQETMPDKKLTLVIYGAEKYFSYQKTAKRREVREQVLGAEGKVKPNKKDECYENAPYVSHDDWETAMTELHLFANCSHRLIEDPLSLAAFIKQFTKAIAEAPFKHEKYEREQENLQWYAAGDSRDCVRVDKNGNGLFRLWEQQLCQFSRVGMETAQAIAAVYRSPSSLVQAYENCSTEREAELLLEAVPVRRGVGPLTTVKKVGPDLSKKVYTFFTALDGRTKLSQD